MNKDVEAIRDELARHLVEALMHLRAEACDVEGTVRDAEVIERLSAVAYFFDEVHGRILALAEAGHGAAFAAWVGELLARFDRASHRYRWSARAACRRNETGWRSARRLSDVAPP